MASFIGPGLVYWAIAATRAVRNHQHCSDPDGVVLSNGPGDPAAVVGLVETLSEVAGECPTFGICLGHQAIIESFGGSIINSNEVCHGKVHQMKHFCNCIIFIMI